MTERVFTSTSTTASGSPTGSICIPPWCSGFSISWGASFGYRPYGNWTGVDAPFILDDAGRLLDRTDGEAEPLALVTGIERLRDALRQAGACVRLVGLSGTGKTRLVQALFEDAVGSGALAPEVAVYVDTGDEPNPPVREVLARLVAGGQRTILVVDNCTPEMHRSLAKELQRAASSSSLFDRKVRYPSGRTGRDSGLSTTKGLE